MIVKDLTIQKLDPKESTTAETVHSIMCTSSLHLGVNDRQKTGTL